MHDSGRVTILVFFESVEICDSIIEGFLGEFASDVRTVQDLIVKDGVVQGKTESDRMCRFQGLALCDGLSIAILRVLDHLLAPVANQIQKVKNLLKGRKDVMKCNFHYSFRNGTYVSPEVNSHR